MYRDVWADRASQVKKAGQKKAGETKAGIMEVMQEVTQGGIQEVIPEEITVLASPRAEEEGGVRTLLRVVKSSLINF